MFCHKPRMRGSILCQQADALPVRMITLQRSNINLRRQPPLHSPLNRLYYHLNDT